MIVDMIWVHAGILGAVEGLSEFLPISSTAHLILTSSLLGLEQTAFQKTFEIVIQLGAILAVLVLYARYLLRHLRLVPLIITGFLPTAVIGFLLYGQVKLLFDQPATILWALFLGGIVLIVFEPLLRRACREGQTSLHAITVTQAAGIGLSQSLALVPGVSRSAATILGGMALGLEKRASVEFSFLLAIPTIIAASALDLLRNDDIFTAREWGILLWGTLASFIVALIILRWFLRYVQRHPLSVFGWYRIALALAFWSLLSL